MTINSSQKQRTYVRLESTVLSFYHVDTLWDDAILDSCSHLCVPTWIKDQQSGPHASQLVVSYITLHEPCSNCGGLHLHCAKYSWVTWTQQQLLENYL